MEKGHMCNLCTLLRVLTLNRGLLIYPFFQFGSYSPRIVHTFIGYRVKKKICLQMDKALRNDITHTMDLSYYNILPPRFQESPISLWDTAITEWSTGHNEPLPFDPMSH